QHLARCQSCSAKLADFRRVERSLTRKLYRWDCPPNQELGEYQLGLLSYERTMAVKSHLSSCVLCSLELATLSQFLANDPMLVEHVSVQSSLNNKHVSRAVKPLVGHLRDVSSGQIRRITATFLTPQPRLAYQREVASTDIWPRSYSAEDFNISIHLDRGASRRDSLQLIGFVTRKGSSLESLQGIPVVLSSQTNTVYKQNIDELGNFVFSSISPASYTLELQLSDSTIVIEQLPVTLQE
ncbi:MAG TPA: hypothetical protein VE843_10495, partial [Ktedonobacteraceae bacterium]|nr:hypothetical protein [Ktedonobacteraceae bacterium]